MAIIKSFASYQNLSNFGTFINDQVRTSEYFRITEFKDTFTGGKNGFLIEGSEHLKETTEIKIEILDVTGTPIYYEPGNGIPEYYEGTSKLVAVYVYEDTPIGLGKVTILGEAKTYIDTNGNTQDVPDEWKGIYNLKWERTFQINRLLSNEDKESFLKSIQIYVAPNTGGESFGIILTEALSAGTAVVASDIPAFRAVLENGEAGELFKNEDPSDLAKVLVSLLRDSDKRKRLSENGRLSAQKYDWQVVAEQIESVYEMAIAGGQRVTLSSENKFWSRR